MNTETIFYGGVDPGEYGCVAFYAPPCTEYREGFLHFIDTRIKLKTKQRSQTHMTPNDLVAQISLFTESFGKPRLTVIETPHSLPRDGHVGAFTFGKSCGIIEGIFYGLGFPQYGTVPAVWKSQMGLSSDKSRSIKLAKEKFFSTLIPQGLEMFEKPAKHADGRAEAALLAWMCAHKLGRSKI